METINDIKNEEGNPRAKPVAGRPQSIFSFFNGSSARLVSLILMILGFIVLAAGSILFVAPLMIAGVVLLVVSALSFMWNKPPARRGAL